MVFNMTVSDYSFRRVAERTLKIIFICFCENRRISERSLRQGNALSALKHHERNTCTYFEKQPIHAPFVALPALIREKRKKWGVARD